MTAEAFISTTQPIDDWPELVPLDTPNLLRRRLITRHSLAMLLKIKELRNG